MYVGAVDKKMNTGRGNGGRESAILPDSDYVKPHMAAVKAFSKTIHWTLPPVAAASLTFQS